MTGIIRVSETSVAGLQIDGSFVERESIYLASSEDELKLTVKNAAGEVVLEKVYSNIQDNRISVELTSEESALMPPGNYVYGIDWYQNGVFQCNLLPVSRWAVMNKV
jgi:hypothetical protein